MTINKIKKKELPCYKHNKFLEEQELLLQEGFDLVTDKMVEALLKLFKREKLAKSDPETIRKLLGTASKRGFTGEIPRIEIDLKFTENLIDKYLQAIKWMVMGKASGKDVEDIVEALKLKDILPVGVVFGTFLNAIDNHRELYETIKAKPAPKINNNALKYTLDFVNERSGKWVDQSLLTYKNRVLQNIQDQIEEFNNENINETHKDFHNLLEDRDLVANQIKSIEEKQKIIAQSVRNVVEKKMSLVEMKQNLIDTTRDYGKDWERLVNTEVGMASGAGSHLAMQEVFGSEDDEMLVASVNVRSSRCCKECEQFSRHPDGSLKIYRLKDIKPVGYNIGRKRRDWILTPSPIHPNCFCTLVYIPKGFTVDNDGDLVKLNTDNERIIVERSAALP